MLCVAFLGHPIHNICTILLFYAFLLCVSELSQKIPCVFGLNVVVCFMEWESLSYVVPSVSMVVKTQNTLGIGVCGR